MLARAGLILLDVMSRRGVLAGVEVAGCVHFGGEILHFLALVVVVNLQGAFDSGLTPSSRG